jgi:hypothetical protein
MKTLYRIGNRLVSADNPVDAVIMSGLPPAFIPGALETVAVAEGPLFKPGIYSGCTRTVAARLGAHVGINARSGEFWRNEPNYQGNTKIDRRNARHAVRREAERQNDLAALRAQLKTVTTALESYEITSKIARIERVQYA